MYHLTLLILRNYNEGKKGDVIGFYLKVRLKSSDRIVLTDIKAISQSLFSIDDRRLILKHGEVALFDVRRRSHCSHFDVF